jgi:hypothetical protein
MLSQASIEQAIQIVKNVSYPYEVDFYKFIKNPINLSIIDKHQRTIIKKNKNYSFLCKASHKFKTINKNLGLIIINKDELAECNFITARYSFAERIKSKRHDTVKSCFEYWNTDCMTVINLAVKQLELYKSTYTSDQLPPSGIALENECALSLLKTGIPGSFPSTIVTTLLDEFKQLPEFNLFSRSSALNNIRMLDISAGWGDRLLAACSRNINYTGCDPNSKLVSVYEKIIAENGDCKKQEVMCYPFEDQWENDKKYNFLLSSPPFFNLEIYSDEQTQSSSRYNTIEKWLNGFLKPSLAKCACLLENGSPVILHLSDVIDFKNPSKSIVFVEDIIMFCIKELHWKFIGNYGFAIQDIKKKSESSEQRQLKDESKLNPRGVIKTYNDGLRCNKNGDILSQPLWVFKS